MAPAFALGRSITASRSLTVGRCLLLGLVLTLSGQARAEPIPLESDPPPSLEEPLLEDEGRRAEPFEHPEEEARAQLDSRVIVLLRMRGDQHVMAQLKAELSASSFVVVELRQAPSDHRSLPEIARDLTARAVLRPGADRLSVDIWVYRPSGAPTDAEETVAVDTPDLAEQVLAFRVTEALRAHGLRINQRPPETPPELPPPPPEPQKIPRFRARGLLWIEGAPAFSVSPGGLPSELSVYLSAGARLHRRWSIGALGSVPVLGQTIVGSEGRATIRSHLVGGALDAFPFDGRSNQVGVRVGLVATISAMRGEAQSGFVSQSDTVIAVAPIVGLSGHIDLSRRLQFIARAMGGVSVPEIQVQFAERAAATWGQPFLLLTAGLQLSALGP